MTIHLIRGEENVRRALTWERADRRDPSRNQDLCYHPPTDLIWSASEHPRRPVLRDEALLVQASQRGRRLMRDASAMGARRPRSVYDEGDEPDPRFSLANERTFLAWIRTSLGLIAGAVALHSLRVPETDWVRKGVVVILLLVAAGFAVNAALRWAHTERAMRLGLPLPGFAFTGWIAGAIVGVAVILSLAFVVV